MKVQVLGPGCAKCFALMNHVRIAVTALNLPAEIEKIEDIKEIMKFRVMATPALAIDGQVKFSGRVASSNEIKEILNQYVAEVN
jgi:small redox-active disulfide protein 2